MSVPDAQKIAKCNSQSTLRPLEVHVLLEIELCIICMGDNDIHTMCMLEQEMVDHVKLK